MANIPIFNAEITDDLDGVLALALVDLPAIECDFLYFEKDKEYLKYSIENEEKRIIFTPIMRANFPIYRYDEYRGEFYVKYSPEVIETMSKKMLKDNTFNNFNSMHTDNLIDGMECVELFIKNTEMGIDPKGFEQIENGSLFGKFKVNDDNIWQMIKDGTFKGISLEGVFNIVPEKVKTKNKMIDKFKETLKKMFAKYGQEKTTDGVVLNFPALEVGEDALDEALEPLADGTYVLENGTEVVVADGKITAINEKPEDAPEDAPVEAKEEDKEDVEQKCEEETPETPEETPDEVEALKAEIEVLKGEIDAIKEMLKAPAAEPVEETFEKQNPINTKDSKLKAMCDRFASLKK